VDEILMIPLSVGSLLSVFLVVVEHVQQEKFFLVTL